MEIIPIFMLLVLVEYVLLSWRNLRRKARKNPWKPIATAPKDGTDILAKDEYHIYVAWYMNGNAEWLLQAQTNSYPNRIVKKPTHWKFIDED